MRRIQWFFLILASLILMGPNLSSGQDQPADNMQILREKIRADKKLVVAVNMRLTTAEAKAFWPIYEHYQKDQIKYWTRFKSLIEKYAKNYKTMTDNVAKDLVDEWFAIQANQLKLQRSYLPKFRKVLPDVKVMRYYQLESKIEIVIRHEIASIIPLALK